MKGRTCVGLMFFSSLVWADWPVLSAGEIICSDLSSAMEQAQYFLQGVEDIAVPSKCGKLKADFEYVTVGAEFIRDGYGNPVASVNLVKIKKNGGKFYHVPRN